MEANTANWRRTQFCAAEAHLRQRSQTQGAAPSDDLRTIRRLDGLANVLSTCPRQGLQGWRSIRANRGGRDTAPACKLRRSLEAAHDAFDHRAEVHSHPEGERVEREADASRVARREVEVVDGAELQPARVPVVAIDGGGAGRLEGRLKDAPVIGT